MFKFFFRGSLWSTFTLAFLPFFPVFPVWAFAASEVALDDAVVVEPDHIVVSGIVVKEGQQRIQLNGDGTWLHVPGSGYATAGDGKRIRLDADGTWRLISPTADVSDGPTASPTGGGTKRSATAAVESGSNNLALLKVEVLKKQRKRAKSTHTDTRTLFHLRLLNETGRAVELNESLASHFIAQTNTGTQLPVESISFSSARIETGDSGRVSVVADGSPRWFGVKRLELLIAPGALGNVEEQKLAEDMADVEFRFVDNF